MKAYAASLIAFALALGSSLAFAGQADFVQLGSFGTTGGWGGGWGWWRGGGGGGGTATINLGTWAVGDGTQTWSKVNCAASANYSNSFYDPPPWYLNPPAVHEPYQFMLQDLDPPSGYYLYLNANSNNTGNARIPVQAQFEDVKAGTGFQTLSDGVYDTLTHDGQFRSCRNGNNAELQITLPNTELENARAGTYTGHFRGQIEGGTSGTATSSSDFNLLITVANIVRVSGLSDINLGAWSGTGNLSGSTTFCIYSNTSSAGYTVTFLSANQSGSTFRLANAAGTSFVPYTVQFADSVSGAGTTVSTAPISGVGNNTQSNCGGVDDAQLNVTVLAANLQGLPPQPFSDTITLQVAPQ